jgi:hypothetical protein
MTSTAFDNKFSSNKLSEQVKSILASKGLSKIFNYSDYQYFKSKANTTFSKAQVIADLFIQECQEESDFSEYIF